MFRQGQLRLFIVAAFLALLAACATLPEDYPRQETWKLDTSQSRLAVDFAEKQRDHPGQSGAYPLSQGIEALAARVALIRAAEKTLDVQYYIWHGDESGKLLLKELLDAADRGVRVRLLLDDLGAGAKNDNGYILLNSHPNLSVSLFNPIASRDARTMGLFSDPQRLNHRMHNKSITADNTLTVVGGRNVGNEYFSLNELVNFADMDVLAVGRVADEVTDVFDIFWNSEVSIPISAFHAKAPSAEDVERARKHLETDVLASSGPYYEAMESSPFGMQLKSGSLEFYWGKINVLYDVPDKLNGEGSAALLLMQLGNLLGRVRSDMLIVSPYFVPGEEGTKALIRAERRGVRVRVLTNSLASTDVGAVHAGYKKYRRELLQAGVEIFELMPCINADSDTFGHFSQSGSSAASLHAKMFIFDHKRVFVGSMNLDPRSIRINTEIGLLIESPSLAAELEDYIESGRSSAYYSVVLEPEDPEKPAGKQRLVWVERRDGEEIRHTKEPETSFWQRLGVGAIGALPIESQL